MSPLTNWTTIQSPSTIIAAQWVLDVVPEDPQVQHVARDVEEAAVQEHRGEDRHDRRRELARHRTVPGDTARDGSELEDERLRRARVAIHPDRGLVEKDEDV